MIQAKSSVQSEYSKIDRLPGENELWNESDLDKQDAFSIIDNMIQMPKPWFQAVDGSGSVEAYDNSMEKDIVFGSNRNPRTTSNIENEESALSRPLGDSTIVKGFPIDNRYCFCDLQIEKQIDWVRFMADLFHQCKRETDGRTAVDAVVCKENKLEEAGEKTKLVGSVDSKGNVNVDEWPGPCGPIFQFGVGLHEAVHRDYVAHGRPPVLEINRRGRPKKQKEMRDIAEISAREYSANEVKAYKEEERYLKKVLKTLENRCTPGDYLTADPDTYRQACDEIDLEMGLDWEEGTTWSRRDIEGDWPGLKGKCWWYIDPSGGGGYNCYGYCLQDVEGGLRDVEPGLEMGETFDDYFKKRGYERTSGTGDIALFSGSHVARRSQYTFKGIQLWESKLSREAPLILHQLKDIEGRFFGEVTAYYSRMSQ